jgi:ubiquitin-activating enzyme E1 C
MCTIRETPRLPEHCIQYAYVIEWEEHFGKTKTVDKDSMEDMKWICAKAEERAATFGIKGVDYNLTMGVVKNIIPAIASTNALVSAACVTEVIKILTGCNQVLDNYMQYMGQTGVNTTTYQSERNDDCMVCSIRFSKFEIKTIQKLSEVLEHIKTVE